MLFTTGFLIPDSPTGRPSIESLPMPICVVDPQFRIAEANETNNDASGACQAQ